MPIPHARAVDARSIASAAGTAGRCARLTDPIEPLMPATSPARAKRKVLLIGWDAADWKVIHPLMNQGKMPNLARLVERGAMGNLMTLRPVLSPMLWTSIATGKRPYKHGVLGFQEVTPDGSAVQPVSQRSRRTKALWNILNQQGLRSLVVGWWPSWPAEPIDGVMVSNHFQRAVGPLDQPWPMPPGTVHPPHLTETLAGLRFHPSELEPSQVLPFVPKALEIDQDKDRRLAAVMKVLAECTSVHNAATWLMAHEDWDLCAVYYDAIDHFSHGFMKYHPPRREHIPEADFNLYHGVVEAAYRFHDMMLGTLLDLAGPETTVGICSDHGFHPDALRPVRLPKEPAGPAAEHRELGMLAMAGPGVVQDQLIYGASLLDVTPTILSLLGLPCGADMDGKPLVQALTEPGPLERIPSWDAVSGNDARLRETEQFNPIAAKAALDQLVALGYIEPPGDDAAAAVQRTERELRYNLARSYIDGGLQRKALPLLEALYRDAPDQYRYGIQLGLCHRSLGEADALLDLVERLSAHRRAAADDAREQIARLRRDQGIADDDTQTPLDPERLSDDDKGQLEDWRTLARLNLGELDYLRGWALGAKGLHREALEVLERARQGAPRRPMLQTLIGETHLALRDWRAAEQAFDAALDIDDLSPQAHLGLAIALLHQGRTERAAELALETIWLRFHYPMAHYVLGLALVRLGEPRRAEEAWRTAVTQAPGFTRAHRLLLWLYRRLLSDPQKAAEQQAQLAMARCRRRSTAPPASAESQGADPASSHGPAVPAVAVHDGQGTDDAGSFDDQDCIVVVSGLPRSGTSMMMQMLAAGGLPILTDGRREADASNPRGYYELEAATRLRTDAAWLADAHNKGVKIVAQLLPFLPAGHSYRVILMERDLEEVLTSQHRMLARKDNGQTPTAAADLGSAFTRQLSQVRAWLAAQPHIRTLQVDHAEVIAEPRRAGARIAAFLGRDLDSDAMADAVDTGLYRERQSLGATRGSASDPAG
ncbi:hypothetical protein CKO31_07345 [Thiohalocapsa halophila]|uniref:Tetratricopeptide repeat protein n=2 Tax=Thiohalocapsa halophila TaxID=69359 RepID=A0ABS1CF87_9GAMM|nr:hypothetical protein [Thiohalocapsa halophila]